MRSELERVSPEAVGVHSEAVMHFVEKLESTGAQLHGLMILRHGKVLAEGWWSPYAPGIRHGCQSLTKTYTSTAIGLLYDEGRVRLDERIVDIFPAYVPDNPSQWLLETTVKDVLCMSTGIYQFPNLTSDQWLKQYMELPRRKQPGEGFYYCSATSSLLAAIVLEKTGEHLLEYLKPRLFDKIGIDADNLRILKMADGRDNGGGGLFSTTEDNARLMQLYLNQGIWNGEQILSKEWIAMATRYQNSTEEDQGIQDCHLGYGFQMWMCKPEGVYRADGAYGQYAIVVPKLDMVISINELAHLGVWPQKILDIVWEEFLPDVEEGDSRYEEDQEKYRILKKKLDSLCLKKPIFRPQADFAKKNPVSQWKLEKNQLSIIPSSYHFLCGIPVEGIGAMSFDFSRTDEIQWKIQYGTEEYSFIIGTDGNGRYNTGLPKESVSQLTYIHGCWKEECILEIHVQYIETCFEKIFTLQFENDTIKVQLEEANTSVTQLEETREYAYGQRITAESK